MPGHGEMSATPTGDIHGPRVRASPKFSVLVNRPGAVGEFWITPTGDIHGPCEQTSAKLANIRVPPSDCDSRQWWFMALFLSMTQAFVVEKNSSNSRVRAR